MLISAKYTKRTTRMINFLAKITSNKSHKKPHKTTEKSNRIQTNRSKVGKKTTILSHNTSKLANNQPKVRKAFMFLTMKSKNIQTNKLVDVTLDKNKTNKKMSPETSALI